MSLLHTNQQLLLEQPLFTFAVIGDTHIKLEQGDESSPFQASKLANGRTRYVVKQLERLSPDFVIHLGDIIHPVPILPTYEPTVRAAKSIFAPLSMPMYFIPGNHDIGDKPANWMPGPKVTQEGIARFERHWGTSFFSFDHKGVHVIGLNASVLNSGFATEQKQRTWLEADLVEHQGKRIALFMHYPLFIEHAEEDEHYDNVKEPARSWLLSLLHKYNVSAVYAGHVHQHFYNRHGRTELHVQPSTTFYRPDYSELFRTLPAPESEGARNDVYKLGFFMVKVYRTHLVNHFIRTNGKTDSDEAVPCIEARHTRETENHPIGVYMRHGWADVHTIPYANLDEFGRKIVRNDIPLLALWETGMQKLRVPLGDVKMAHTRKRMEALCEMGCAFTVFSVGIPDPVTMDVLLAHHRLVAVWELALAEGEWAEAIPFVLKIKRATQIQTCVTEMITSAATTHGTKFVHFIKHGFTVEQQDVIADYLRMAGAREAFDRWVFRLEPHNRALEETDRIVCAANELNVAASIHVLMQGSDNASFVHDDDLAIASRVAEIAVNAFHRRETAWWFDTWLDHDRGYFRRNGFLDSLCNPRPAFYVLKHLTALLLGEPYTVSRFDEQALLLSGSEQSYVLALSPQHGGCPAPVFQNSQAQTGSDVAASMTLALVYDLVSGEMSEERCRIVQSEQGWRILPEKPLPDRCPTLIQWKGRL